MKRKQGSSGNDDDNREGDGPGESAAKKVVRAAPDICDDALLGIFSGLTFRDASRCAAMSRHHRQLIGGMDFWLLHHRLSPPLPRPHIAYMATNAALDPSNNARRRPAPAVAPLLSGCMFLDFHLAGGGDKDELMRYSLIDRVHRFHKYVGTCDGIILMAPESFDGASASILLLNPAVAGGEVEVNMDLPSLRGQGRYRVTGFGYGPSRRAHKLLLVREERYYSPTDEPTTTRRAICYHAKELLVYTLGELGAGIPSAAANQQRLRSVLSSELDGEISGTSVYLDGKVYLFADHSRVLEFDVDEETVTAIDLPTAVKHEPSKLMEVSGRLCVAAGGGVDLAMWLLASDGHEWVRLCKFWCGGGGGTAGKLAGAWDCGGVLLLYFRHNRTSTTAYLHLYDTRAEKELARPVLPRTVAAGSGLVLCSGYRPTLVPPGSIVGGGGARPRQRGVLAALKPLVERDVAAGRERTLEAVCFMDLLLYIMSKLPDNPLDAINEIKRRTLPFSVR